MRADTINKILGPKVFNVIDTNIPFFDTPHIWRTVGFRFKIGPLIKKINSYLLSRLKHYKATSHYDLIWVDKGIFLKPGMVGILKGMTRKLVHFTPDMAFYENRSSLFNRSIPLYDFLITTKTRERELYLNRIDPSKLIMTTQGFDKKIHCSHTKFEDKRDAVSFIGLWEPYREQVIQNLIDNDIKVFLAGKGWNDFVKRNKSNGYLEYHGEGLFSHEYAKFISNTKMGLGLMSKRFPELHTTRTFEIPACGTALITERNPETSGFFDEDEVIFYKDTESMVQKIKLYLNDSESLKGLTERGTDKVNSSNFDYDSILNSILTRILG